MGKETKAIKKEIETKPIQEDKFLIEDFVNNCEALGYRKEVVAGALFDYKNKELSKTEFKKIVKEFLNKEVK
ncbi:hypothetical protein [Metaclostridioides mangenotii]|uniref:hypothetical protein n=1 Tax=Metaclostridioides mangenotii TaxID=1540 RepID=UPI0028F0F438|nr:hypothetical protein [Clostridioides mangenotii]